jgi:hypothetical protein
MNLYDVFPFDSADVDLKQALRLLNDLALPEEHPRRHVPAEELMQDALRLIARAAAGLEEFGMDLVECGVDDSTENGPVPRSAPFIVDADAVAASQAISAAATTLREAWKRSEGCVLPKDAIGALEAAFPGPFTDRLAHEQSALDTF